jgi:ligand-binding SRPBCC domain-containing protein
MPAIKLETIIDAPIERVFNLARSIDLHAESMSKSEERPIDGVMSGLIELGQTVTREAVHFGIRQRLTSKITACDRPRHLQDIMVSGAFIGFTHDHFFTENGGATTMKDVFDYRSPLGFLGKIADVLFLERYMTDLLKERNRRIKLAAETEEWQRFIPTDEL